MIRVEISTMAYCYNTHRSFASILVWWPSIVDGHCPSFWCRSSSPSHLKRGADTSWRRCHCGGLHLNLWRKRSSLLAETLRYQHMTNRRWPGVYKHICQPAYKDPATAFAGSYGVSFKTQMYAYNATVLLRIFFPLAVVGSFAYTARLLLLMLCLFLSPPPTTTAAPTVHV